MLGKIIPILIAVIGAAAGLGAGIALRPAADLSEGEIPNPCGEITSAATFAKPKPEAAKGMSEFVSLNNQFVFPLVEAGNVAALVVLSLTLEVAEGQADAVHTREPKLRDGFLRVLLDHANAGGFQGAFTSNETMEKLRRALLEKGREELGEALYDILILDINRQDS
ncbi:MAG: flagellar basal body-associated FliL family protein [Rhodobacterales bacterium]|nr:flagellar basal body-associated FliL family protein [Rhodobacterales bacterium]